jgi:pyridoxine 5-phosphate synthase
VSTVHSSHTALSVNVNKVALLRNTRHLGTPSVVRAATLCLQAGASGITVHPRPDERHIRANDVHELAQLLQTYPHAEYNIEGNPFHNLMGFVEAIRPAQCTLVPDSSDQFTSDQGWQFPQDAPRLKPIVEQLNAWGVRVSLFMDPTPEAMTAVAALGAQRVELYTETYASAYGTATQSAVTAQFTQTSKAALQAGMQVNAGHDLNLVNLAHFLQQLPQVVEVSIGHALIGDALEMGYHATVKAYLASIEQANSGRAQ